MIDDQGCLKIPLYHGTSSLFVDSIRVSGLGGSHDPELFDHRILSLLAECLSKCENLTEYWEGESLLIEKMLNQSVTEANFNFRYGGVYLTPSRFTARRYAENKMGSEFLSTIHDAFVALGSVNPLDAERIIPAGHKLRKVFQGDYKPVLITAHGVSKELLKTEQGKDIQDQIESMVDIKNKVDGMDSDALWQQYNFEFCGVISPNLLQFADLN